MTATKFNILTNGEALSSDKQPQIITTYDETNNVVTMQFKIPRGFQGITKTTIPGNVDTLPPTKDAEQVEHLAEATVTVNEAMSDASKIAFDFGIPAGLTGEQGPEGPEGKKAIINVRNVSTVKPTSSNTIGQATAKVTLTNASQNAYALDFGIPAGIKGEKGDKGDRGAALVPKGGYSDSETYFANDMVRCGSAQYYVIDDNGGQGIHGLAPTNSPANWTIFLRDGSGTAANASTLFSFDENCQEDVYTGMVLLDTNTFSVVSTNVCGGTYNMMTVVGGAGGGSGQWDIDEQGNIMPAIEQAYGKWEYDPDTGDIMPPAL